MKLSRVGLALAITFQAADASAAATVTVANINSTTYYVTDPVAISGLESVQPSDPNYNSSSYGQASADMTAGTMRAFSIVNVLQSPGSNQCPIGGPLATAKLDDTITVMGPSGTVNVTVTVSVDGSFVNAPIMGLGCTADFVYIGLATGMGATQKSQQATIIRNQVNDGGPTYSTMGPVVGPTDAGVTNDTPVFDVSMTSSFTVGTPTAIIASVGVAAEGSAATTATVDFGSTGRLSISLPPGYTYTSASGVLLSSPGAPGLSLDGGSGGPGSQDGGAASDGGSVPPDGSVLPDAGGNADGGTGSGGGGCATSSGFPGASAGVLLALVLLLKRRR